MVQATGSPGGTILHSSELIFSSGVVAQALNKINITDIKAPHLKVILCKIPAPGHAQPDNRNQGQAEQDSCRAHVLGPAG